VPAESLTASSLPGRLHLAARRLASIVATATNFGLYRLAARSMSPGAIPVAHCYWFLALYIGPKGPQSYNA